MLKSQDPSQFGGVFLKKVVILIQHSKKSADKRANENSNNVVCPHLKLGIMNIYKVMPVL